MLALWLGNDEPPIYSKDELLCLDVAIAIH